MKAVLVLLLLAAACAFAQDPAAIAAAESACGPKEVRFNAERDSTQHPAPQAESDKALVYVVQDIGENQCRGCALTRVGVDGSWVGANQGSSYFFFTATPGEHHVCVNWQSVLGWRAKAFGMADFTAEAGKVYYFRSKFFFEKAQYSFDLAPINSDQGKYMVALSAYCVSNPRK
jgi:hypothetical protein